MRLTGRNAIVYGAGGTLGAAVAAALGRDGAELFLVGRTRDHLEDAAATIAAEGGRAHVAVLDVFDEQAVDEHAGAVVERAGGVDVSINLVGRHEVHGIRLVDMTVPDFTRPLFAGVTATFITARAAARQMIRQGSGVILVLTGEPSTPAALRGGAGPADAATGALVRDLDAEVAPHGVQVVCVRGADTDAICTEAVTLAATDIDNEDDR